MSQGRSFPKQCSSGMGASMAVLANEIIGTTFLEFVKANSMNRDCYVVCFYDSTLYINF